VNVFRFSTDDEIDFVLDAVAFVSTDGWKLMPQFIFNNETGEWKHHTDQVVFLEIFYGKRILGLGRSPLFTSLHHVTDS
jgi:hypothetical protein